MLVGGPGFKELCELRTEVSESTSPLNKEYILEKLSSVIELEIGALIREKTDLSVNVEIIDS